MHQLSRAIGVACLSWILSAVCSAAPQGGNVDHVYRYMRRQPVYYDDAYNFHPSSSFMSSVPTSRSDMAPNASPFQMSAYKNPLYLRSLINTVSSKLATGAYASKRFDLPNILTPPGSNFGPPGSQFGAPGSHLGPPRAPGLPLLYMPQNYGAPQVPPVPPVPLLPNGLGGGLQGFPFPAHSLPTPQAQGNPLSPEEFQRYLKEAAGPAPNTPQSGSNGEYLSQGEFQKYLKLASKKNKVNPEAVLSPEEFQKFVLAAQDARDEALLKSGKPRPGKLHTLTPEDFKKFFASTKEKGKLPIAGPGQFKKHKRGGQYSSSGYSTGSSSYSEYPPPPPPPKYPPPPKHESNPPPEAYPDFYHNIETEDQATKRSVLDALWRAFQAITGGALTIGGHLARGGGAILQAKGKLIASAGPVVSDFGKTIATKAVAPSHSPSYSHGTPYHYSDPYADEHHSSHSSLLQTAYDVASSLKVAALGTTKAVADLISELSNASAKAYLLKE